MKPLVLFITSLTLIMTPASRLSADEITEQINTARDAYERGELQTSIQGLQFVIAAIQERVKYSRPDDGRLEIKLTANSPFMPMMTMMFSNPLLLQSQPNTRLYTHAGRRGIVQEDPSAKQWEISLMGEGNLLIQVEGTGIDKVDAEAYLKAIDIVAVEKAFSQH